MDLSDSFVKSPSDLQYFLVDMHVYKINYFENEVRGIMSRDQFGVITALDLALRNELQ